VTVAKRFTDLTPEGQRYFRELEQLLALTVRVGFQAGEHFHEDGADLVDIAVFNELGTSTAPSRPFLRQSFENHRSDLEKLCLKVHRGMTGGGTTEQGLKRLGVELRGLVQREIVEGDFVPNAPSTVRNKGSAQPLIDRTRR